MQRGGKSHGPNSVTGKFLLTLVLSRLELVVRCWDNALNTQPTFVRSTWNWDLHVTSSCHRIKVFSVNRSKPATAKRMKKLEQEGIDFQPLTKPLEIDLESDDEFETEMQRRRGRDPEE